MTEDDSMSKKSMPKNGTAARRKSSDVIVMLMWRHHVSNQKLLGTFLQNCKINGEQEKKCIIFVCM